MRKSRDSELIRKFFSTSFPNPDRDGCPDQTVLWNIAMNTLPNNHPARLHLASCSPCFSEVQELKNHLETELARRRKHALLVAAGVVLAAAIGASVFSSLRGRWGSSEAVRAPAAGSPQTGSRTGERQDLGTDSGNKPFEVALNLRSVEPVRGAGNRSPKALFRLPARFVKLRLTLPLGSDDGMYDVQIQRGREVLKIAHGHAVITDGDTLLDVQLDLSDMAAGSYFLLYRHADASWHRAPIFVTG